MSLDYIRLRIELYAVCSLDTINQFINRPAMISVFLASEFDRSAVKWIFDTWDGLHFETGMYWHVLVPSKTSVYEKGGLQPNDYNFELARELTSMYGLTKNHTPCLVFDSFIESQRHPCIRLEKLNEPQLKRLFLDSTGIVGENAEDLGGAALLHWREKVAYEIYRNHNIGGFGRSALAFLTRPSTILRFAHFGV